MTRGRRAWLGALGATLLVIVLALVSPFASTSPDGLERVAANEGFAERQRRHPLESRVPAPDYALRVVEGGASATILAGVAGAAIVAASLAVGASLVRRRARVPRPPRAQTRRRHASKDLR